MEVAVAGGKIEGDVLCVAVSSQLFISNPTGDAIGWIPCTKQLRSFSFLPPLFLPHQLNCSEGVQIQGRRSSNTGCQKCRFFFIHSGARCAMRGFEAIPVVEWPTAWRIQ
jgi:hypothetical protein